MGIRNLVLDIVNLNYLSDIKIEILILDGEQVQILSPRTHQHLEVGKDGETDKVE